MISSYSTSPISGFVFHDRDATTDANYEYILYKSREGHMLLSKISKDNTEQRFAYFDRSNDRVSVWGNRATYTYVDIDEL